MVTAAAAAGGHEPLTTKEGWRRFVEHTPRPPRLLSEAELATLAPDEREADQDTRLAHHSQLAVVATRPCKR